MADLTMLRFLQAVRDHGLQASRILVSEGHHHNVVLAKAEKAARKGYTDFGTTPLLPWLTEDGINFLETNDG